MKECMVGRNAKWIVILAVSAICVVAINVFSIPAHDELSYAFGGQSTPSTVFCPRVSSLMDIVRQQQNDYVHANGRVFVHGIVAFFAGFRLYYLFDVLNSCIWFAFVFLILKEAHAKINIRNFVYGSLVVFMVWWYNETVSMNAAFAVNYLWMACASIAIMRLWRKLSNWWWLPVGFLYGWGQETFSVPMIAALGGGLIFKSIKERKYVASRYQTAFLVAMLLGVTGMFFSPGNHARASGSLNVSLAQLAILVAKWFIGLALSIWPFVILILLLLTLWNVRRHIFEIIYKDLEWWLFFGASFAISILACQHGLYRICSGWLMAGLILIGRNRDVDYIESKPVCLVAKFSFVWLLVAAMLQVSYGLSNINMLRIYDTDPQGITYRKIIPPTFWNNICSVGMFGHPFHLELFRQEYRKERGPVILSKKLYETLYLNPEIYLQTSVQDGDLYLYDEPGFAVKKGNINFSEEEKAKVDKLARPQGWRRFLPGRFRLMFTTDLAYVCIPSKEHEIPFVAKDGKWYTIYLSAR